MTAISESLSVSTSTVIRQLHKFKFKTDLNHLPEHMSWDEYSFKKGKMSFIAQDYDTRKILAILDGRTQATIRNHFLRYSRQVRSRVKVITMDMFSPYYDEGYSFGWFCIQKNSARTTENTLRYEVRGQRKILGEYPPTLEVCDHAFDDDPVVIDVPVQVFLVVGEFCAG